MEKKSRFFFLFLCLHPFMCFVFHSFSFSLSLSSCLSLFVKQPLLFKHCPSLLIFPSVSTSMFPSLLVSHVHTLFSLLPYLIEFVILYLYLPICSFSQCVDLSVSLCLSVSFCQLLCLCLFLSLSVSLSLSLSLALSLYLSVYSLIHDLYCFFLLHLHSLTLCLFYAILITDGITIISL